MTLYKLTNSMCLQGNIFITVFDSSGRECEHIALQDVDDLNSKYYCDLDDLDDLEITHMYAMHEYCTTYMHIDLVREND